MAFFSVVTWAIPARAGAAPQSVAIVVNADSWASLTIANNYIRLRHIPPANVIYLENVPGFEQIKVNAFRRKILLPVLTTLEHRGLAGQIDYVLYSADFPTAIDVSGDIGGQPLPRVLTPWASLNGLTYLYEFVLHKDIRYLSLDSNWYARHIENGGPPIAWTPLQQQELTTIIQTLTAAVRAHAPRPASSPATTAPAPVPTPPQEDLAAALATAEHLVRKLLQVRPDKPVPGLLYDLACLQAQQGHADAALAALKSAVAAGWWDASTARQDDSLLSLRSRPEFKALLRQMAALPLVIQPPLSFRATMGWSPAGMPVPPNQGLHYLLSTMLACTSGRGTSVEEALNGLRRSAAADGTAPQGTIYYMRNKDVRSTTRAWGFAQAVKDLRTLGVTAVVEDGIAPLHKQDVAGAMMGSPGIDWAASGSTILPGAIVEHLTSCGGMMQANAGQTPLSEFLRYGAAAASGTVAEPYALQAKFPTPFLHVFYASGCTLAESFYQAIAGPYQLLIIGDALCRPWAPAAQVHLAVPPGPWRGTVQLAPSATIAAPNSAQARTVVAYEIFLDGRRLAILHPGTAYNLDTTLFPDGPHDLSVVSDSNSPVDVQGYQTLAVTFANGPVLMRVEQPAHTRIPWDQPIRLTAHLHGAKSIVWMCNDRPLQRLTGPGGEVSIDPRHLGQGPVRLTPVGVLDDAGAHQVLGPSVDLDIVPPTPLAALPLPLGKTLVPGFLFTSGSRPPVVISDTQGAWLGKTGICGHDSFTIDALIEVKHTGVHQFQVQGPEVHRLSVDGRDLTWPRGPSWWFVPVSLAQGLHRVRISGRVGKQPALDIRFGGRGTQHLNASRFRHFASP